MSDTEESINSMARLRAAAAKLNDDELWVVAMVAERMLMGQKQYGHLDAVTDTRNMGLELLQEAADGMAYAAIAARKAMRVAEAEAAPKPAITYKVEAWDKGNKRWYLVDYDYTGLTMAAADQIARGFEAKFGGDYRSVAE